MDRWWMPRWRPFLLGLATGLAALSLLGHVLTSTNNFEGFLRFHRSITPESLYNPTMRQVAALVESRYDPAKVLVIIGGNSVFRGARQRDDGLWSVALQNELGDSFTVINLAVNGQSYIGFASWISEYEMKLGRKLLFVTDGGEPTDHLDPDGPNKVYKYALYQAWWAGYLMPSAARDKALLSAASPESAGLFLQAGLNDLLGFDELWNYVALNIASPVYNIYTPTYGPYDQSPWWPRRLFNDADLDVPGTVQERDTPELRNRELYIVRLFKDMHVSCVAARDFFATIIPEKLQGHSIFVQIARSSYYRRMLEPEEQKALKQFYMSVDDAFDCLGLAHVSMYDDWDDLDYADNFHFTAAGGKRLALRVAGAVRRKAAALNYF